MNSSALADRATRWLIVERYRVLLVLAMLLAGAATTRAAEQVPPPLPVRPIPSRAQLQWQKNELAMFVHFTVNTFTDREWGTGKENPEVFQPTDLSTDQWARVAQECGFRTIILTAKHHDGFCLWPTAYTDHSVESSAWRDGNGDVVGALANSCREHGVDLGLYLSPWDRHEPTYGRQRYNEFYVAQVRELLDRYGPVREFWADGAKGEDAEDMTYQAEIWWDVVHQESPGALCAILGPDIRWVGNEEGVAPTELWSTEDGTWRPAETDTSIRPGWFWHPDEDPKSVQELVDIYFKSVGRNSKLLLNVPPNREGRLAEEDVERLRTWRSVLDKIFDKDLASGGTAQAGSVWGGSDAFGPAQVLDGELGTYWAAARGQTDGRVIVRLPEEASVNVISLQEPIQMGQRVAGYHVDVHVDGGWKTVAEGTTIGYKRLHRIETASIDRLRLVVEETRDDNLPLIAEIGAYMDPRRD